MKPTLVFDLDGTLAETAADLMNALNVVLKAAGLPALPLEKKNELIGAGARNLVVQGFRLAGGPLDPAAETAQFEAFLDVYERELCVHTRLFPGVVQALDALRSDFTLAVCTNKVERHSRLLIEALGIADRFAVICGGDSFPWKKPDPRHLEMTVQRAGGTVQRAIMVGDSSADIEAARGAGIPVIAVPFGYTERPIRELGADLVIDSFDELPAAVRRLRVGRGWD